MICSPILFGIHRKGRTDLTGEKACFQLSTYVGLLDAAFPVTTVTVKWSWLGRVQW